MSDLRTTLRVLRAERDLSQKALAEASGLSPAYISQLEAGHKSPSVATLERLATALGIPVSELLARAEATENDTAANTNVVSILGGGAVASRGRPLLPRLPGTAHRGRARALADEVLRDPARARALASQARAVERDAEAWRLGDLRGDVRMLIEMVDCYADGSYRAVPWDALILVVAGLQYLVNPEDVVPDYLEQGYLDDAAVLAFITEMIAPDLDAFSVWLAARG